MDKKEYDRNYYLTHKKEIKERVKQWQSNNVDKVRKSSIKRTNKYHNTPRGRACHLLSAYNKSDENRGRGKGDLTAEWIVENIFSKPCAHCGKTGWKIIGCNRLNNDLPHTKDNVEPCCRSCNAKEQAKTVNTKHVFQYTIEKEFVKEWKSIKEAAENCGFKEQNIFRCCTGKQKTGNGYRWSYKPL